MDLGLKGKNVFITGSADGFGKELALQFASEGANVLLHARKTDNNILKIEQLKTDLIQQFKVKSDVIYCDLSDLKDVEKIIDKAITCFDIDILINNAAIWPTAFVKEMLTEDFKKTIDVNLVVPFILCRDFANYYLKNKKKGKIVNMVSQAAFHGSTSGHAHYAASKAGLVGFSISLAREVAPYGICVNCVAPGMMRTPMNKDVLEEREDEYLKRIPLGRIASPSEIAQAVLFLSSEKANYITGATIDATGGMLMR